MDEKFDIIILGSGLSGLICANILSKKGLKVLVLEKNQVPGGTLQTFKRKNVIFDTGIHYVGSFRDGQRMNQLFRYLELLPGIKLRELDTSGFDRFNVAGKEFKYASGYESFVNTLSESFPNQQKTIKRFADKIRNISSSIPLYNLRSTENMEKAFFDKINFGGTWSYLQSITGNPELQNALSSLNFLYAGKREGSLLFVHALIYNHYIESAFRFVDGTHHIANKLIKNLEQNGGTLLTNEEATQFEFDDKQISRVICKSGKAFIGKKFISSLHPQQTLSMVEPGKVRKSYRNRISGIPNTESAFILYLVLKDKTIPYFNHNIYCAQHADVWNCFGPNNYDWPAGFSIYPVADSKDTSYVRGLSVISLMKYEDVEKWGHTTFGRREEAYNAFKLKREHELIEQVGQYYPEIKKNIVAQYSATPLTLRDYLGNPEGSMYGIERNIERPMESFIFPKTRIPNLLLTGQSTSLHGMLGVSIGALLTCAEILDLNQLIKEINNA